MTVMSDEGIQPYQRIFQDIRDQVAAKKLLPGTKLKSTRELAEEYGVATGTVQRALTELRNAGLIYSHQGRGTYISEEAGKVGQDPTALAIRALESKVAELSERLDKIEKGRDA